MIVNRDGFLATAQLGEDDSLIEESGVDAQLHGGTEARLTDQSIAEGDDQVVGAKLGIRCVGESGGGRQHGVHQVTELVALQLASRHGGGSLHGVLVLQPLNSVPDSIQRFVRTNQSDLPGDPAAVNDRP